MQLSQLLSFISNISIEDKEILSVENDSRKAGADSLFVAYSGYVKDAHVYVDSAYQNGCRNFVISQSKLDEFKTRYSDAQWIGVQDLPIVLGKIAAGFYAHPSESFCLIGITGTNGKTTTATAVYQNLMSRGIPAGLIGTIDYRIGDEIFPATNTTPDVLELNRILRKMADKGVRIVVMEVSSHALALGRVLGLQFDIAAFTNLTQDHLDFHNTMDEYIKAKMRLIALLDSSVKSNPTLILNRDMNFYNMVFDFASKYKRVTLKTYSLCQQADYYSEIQSLTASETVFNWQGRKVKIEMIGLPNVANITLASAILDTLGQDPEVFLPVFSNLHVKGRVERIKNRKGIHVIIDYAHTPDALANVLKTLSEVKETGRHLICVFGAGGDRDKTKRPLMAKAAADFADKLFITSDNPRTEDPVQILDDITMGLSDTDIPYEIEKDRKKAILLSLSEARVGDIVLIAGKGHEDYQIIGKTKHHFSDREIAEDYFSDLGVKSE